MIGYVTLGTNDLPRATAFYDALLAEIGATRLMDFGARLRLGRVDGQAGARHHEALRRASRRRSATA